MTHRVIGTLEIGLDTEKGHAARRCGSQYIASESGYDASGVIEKLHTCEIHIHITHHNCLEVILLKGKIKEIQKLGDNIVSLKGVKLGKVNLIAAED